MDRLEHLLIILIEECSETQKAATKALRFGLDEGRDIKTTNLERFRSELSDLFAMIEMLEAEGINLKPDSLSINGKKNQVEKYLLYSAKCGTLDNEGEGQKLTSE